MQIARTMIQEYIANDIRAFDEIPTQEQKSYLAALIILETETKYILESAVNNDNLANVFIAGAKLTQNIYENKGIGFVNLQEEVERLNNEFAIFEINKLFEEESKPDMYPEAEPSPDDET